MRSLLLILSLANGVVFAAQFSVVRRALTADDSAVRPPQLYAERLRIVRDASPGPVPASPLPLTQVQ